ncbi:MAG: hypothetical protein K0V04_12165 [Deltaproteobacteria bacterium]|nr:hypothetical protein [Deltaproteobacteria bacterium]
MPLYLARGPVAIAFLVRARDRHHLNYIIDAVTDPGDFEAEIYDGPLCLLLTVPVSFEREPGAEVRAQFEGSTELEDLEYLPAIEPLMEFHEEWCHLRKRAFPSFAAALDKFEYQDEDKTELIRETVEQAVLKDIADQDTRAALQRRAPAAGEEAVEREGTGALVGLESVLEGGAVHAQWTQDGWVDEEAVDDADTGKDPARLEALLNEAIQVFGEVSLAMTAEGRIWRVGDPVVAEGPALSEIIARASQ